MGAYSNMLLLASLVLPLVSASATPPIRYEFAESKFGPVYTSANPNSKRSNSDGGSPARYHFADSELGPVWTSAAPQKRDTTPNPNASGSAFVPMSQKDVDAYIKEHHPDVWHSSHDDGVAKRDVEERESGELDKRIIYFAMTVACMFNCHQLQVGINTLTVSQQVQFCLAYCIELGEANYNSRVRYMDVYPNGFPPTAGG